MQTFHGKYLENPELHVDAFRFYLLTKVLPEQSDKDDPDEKGLLRTDKAEIETFSETLKDNAQTWFQRVKWGRNGEDEIYDMEGLIKAFKDRFRIKDSETRRETRKLLEMKQERTESIEDFINKVENAARLIYAPEENIRQVVLYGMHPELYSRLQHYIISSVELDDLRKWALRAEAVLATPTITPDMIIMMKKMDEMMGKLEAIQMRPPETLRLSTQKNSYLGSGVSRERSPSPSTQNQEGQRGDNGSGWFDRSNNQGGKRQQNRGNRGGSFRERNFSNFPGDTPEGCHASRQRCHKCRKFGHFRRECRSDPQQRGSLPITETENRAGELNSPYTAKHNTYRQNNVEDPKTQTNKQMERPAHIDHLKSCYLHDTVEILSDREKKLMEDEEREDIIAAERAEGTRQDGALHKTTKNKAQ